MSMLIFANELMIFVDNRFISHHQTQINHQQLSSNFSIKSMKDKISSIFNPTQKSTSKKQILSNVERMQVRPLIQTFGHQLYLVLGWQLILHGKLVVT